MHVIYRGVDAPPFDPALVAPERVAALRAEWGVGANARVVLQAARLTAWKGQSVLIEAARRLKAQGRLGDAVVRSRRRRARARRLRGRPARSDQRRAGLDGRVRMVGHVDDMAAAFLTAHVAVVASTEPEAFGRAATEAQAMGTPVIATDIGAPPETVLSAPRAAREAATGWLVPPSDPDAARRRDRRARWRSTPEERARMGARARAHVLDELLARKS